MSVSRGGFLDSTCIKIHPFFQDRDDTAAFFRYRKYEGHSVRMCGDIIPEMPEIAGSDVRYALYRCERTSVAAFPVCEPVHEKVVIQVFGTEA